MSYPFSKVVNQTNFEVDVDQNVRIELFKAKVEACCQIFNFKDTKANLEEKD
jgi:hypothetical protein